MLMTKHTSPLSPRVLVEFGNRNGVPYVCDESIYGRRLSIQVKSGIMPITVSNIGYPTLPPVFYLWTQRVRHYRLRKAVATVHDVDGILKAIGNA